MKVEEKAKKLGIKVSVLIASKQKPCYKQGVLQYDIERTDGSYNGSGEYREWKPDTTYYVWDMCNEFALSIGTRRVLTFFNPATGERYGIGARCLARVTIPNRLRYALVYYKMRNEDVQMCAETPEEDINISIEDVKYYLDHDVNPSAFKYLIEKKVKAIDNDILNEMTFEEIKIAEFSAVYTTHEPNADTIEEGFVLVGWKPYKYFDTCQIFKTRYWDGRDYHCGYKIVGCRIIRYYEDMTFRKEISSKTEKVNCLTKSWWYHEPLTFEGDLTPTEAKKKYFKILNDKPYTSASVDEIIKDHYCQQGTVCYTLSYK